MADGVRRVPIGDVVSEPSVWNPREAASAQPFQYIDISSIDSTEKRITGAAAIVPSEAPSRARQLVRSADVLVSTVRPNLNAVAIVPEELDGATASTGFAVLRPDPTKIEARYLYHWVRTAAFVRALTARATGASYPAVTESVVRESKLPLPPLAEQRQIAAVLDKADAIRRKRRESLRLLDEFLRSAFLEMFGDPVRNEKGWEVVPLEELVDPGRPITYGILKPGPDTPAGVPYVRVVDMANGTIDHSRVRRTTNAIAESYRRSVLKVGDVLLSIRGHVGRTAAVPEELAGGNITQDTARLALLPNFGRHYVEACLSSLPMQALMRRHVKGVAVTGINLGDVKKLPIPTPPLELQQRFTTVARRHSALTVREHESQETTRQLFDSLAQRAFRGEL